MKKRDLIIGSILIVVLVSWVAVRVAQAAGLTDAQVRSALRNLVDSTVSPASYVGVTNLTVVGSASIPTNTAAFKRSSGSPPSSGALQTNGARRAMVLATLRTAGACVALYTTDSQVTNYWVAAMVPANAGGYSTLSLPLQPSATWYLTNVLGTPVLSSYSFTEF